MKTILLKYVIYFLFIFFVGDVFSQRGAQGPYYDDSDYGGGGGSSFGITDFIGMIVVIGLFLAVWTGIPLYFEIRKQQKEDMRINSITPTSAFAQTDKRVHKISYTGTFVGGGKTW
jgi:hypothetical protein